jgi:hypothetical protein
MSDWKGKSPNGFGSDFEGPDAKKQDADTKYTTKFDKSYKGGLSGEQAAIRGLEDDELLDQLVFERNKLNEIAQDALDNDGSLNVESVHEQNRVVEMLINEALLRWIEDSDEEE